MQHDNKYLWIFRICFLTIVAYFLTFKLLYAGCVSFIFILVQIFLVSMIA
jgi:hypothetical protein